MNKKVFSGDSLCNKFSAEPRFYRRRLQDIRVWKQICDKGFEKAAVKLCRGFSYMCWNGRIRTSSWSERISRSFNLEGDSLSECSLEYLSRCKKDYLAWIAECEEADVCHRATMDILFFGYSLGEVEKVYRRRHGWGLSNLMQCLELYRK